MWAERRNSEVRIRKRERTQIAILLRSDSPASLKVTAQQLVVRGRWEWGVPHIGSLGSGTPYDLCVLELWRDLTATSQHIDVMGGLHQGGSERAMNLAPL